MGNWSDYILKLFQSTLPRRERQNADQEIEAFEKISIHTPTKGATYLSSKLESIWAISIHTPTKGATDDWLKDHSVCKDFNPHSHEGSDFFS